MIDSCYNAAETICPAPNMPPHRSKASRKQAYKRGLRAERLACWLLRIKGYKILEQRYKNSFGEVDIIALRGPILALVEVKARHSVRECLESITPTKQQKQIKAAKALLAYPGKLAPYITNDLAIRFDVICVVPWRLPHHLTNAWQEG